MTKIKPPKQPGRGGARAPRDPISEGGRPTLLTVELLEKLLHYLRQGNYLEVAAAACGVNKATLFLWMKLGSQGDLKYQGFFDAVTKAMSESEVWALQVITKAAAEGNWQAAAWRLERKHPKRWGRQDKVEHTVGVAAQDKRSLVETLLTGAPAEIAAAETIAAKIATAKLLPADDEGTIDADHTSSGS